ncbi:MAG: tetratricopeptide repeat protein [Chloracidobacterium sp.]|nr:tetratricopeptide repeat protein [Chloracidobacterium sp.]
MRASRHATPAGKGAWAQRSWLTSLALPLLIIILAASHPLRTVGAQTPAKRPSGQTAHRKSPASSFDALTKRANEAREADRLEEASALYLKALRLKPAWKEGWWRVGAMYYERDRYLEAREAFLKFVAIDQKFGPALAMLGLCEFQLRQYEPALIHLRQGNLLGVGDNQELRLVTRYHEAILHNRFEEFELAYDVMSRLINERPEGQDLVFALGLTMLRLAYLPPDVPAGKREIALKAGRAAYYMITKRQREAAQEFKELAENYSDSPGAHYAYGVFLLRDDPDAAIEEFRRELRVAPEHVAARLQIAFEMIRQGRQAEGLPYAEEAVKFAPGLFATHNALGRILLETGDIERAVKELEVAARLAPESPEMYFALARAYDRAKRPKDAERARAEFTRLGKIRGAIREGGADTSSSSNPVTRKNDQ